MHGHKPNDFLIFDSLQQRKPDIAHLGVFFMIHDLLHFFHERNQPNFTLVIVKFYNELRNIHYRERFNHVSACVPQLRFLYLSCLLWFDSSVLYSVEFTVQCRCLQIPLSCSVQKHQQNFHLETELDAKNLQCMNVCAVHSTVANVCLAMHGISCKGADQLDYSLGCLKGISDNIPTLASHGMKFIEILIQNT